MTSKHSTLVQSADDMSDETFIKHVELRHPFLRYWARGEHEAFHRLFPYIGDHAHKKASK